MEKEMAKANSTFTQNDLAAEKVQVRPATCGRIVHYFPNEKDEHCTSNGTTVLPAIVIQGFSDNLLNLQVFAMNADGPNVLRHSVPHKSDRLAANGYAYWDWPEVK